MDAALLRIVDERLAADVTVPSEIADLVLAACLDDDQTEGRSGVAPDVETTAAPVSTYVASITVRGFRGVGDAARLVFRPGPGLTLVVGRNGCGKSSFAEGLELLLTGSTSRF